MSLETLINEDYFDTVSSVLLYINTLMALYHLFMSSGSTGELELYRNKLELKFRCKTKQKAKTSKQKTEEASHKQQIQQRKSKPPI